MEAVLKGLGGLVPSRAASETAVDTDLMGGQAQKAASFLKALGHEGRLMILCHLCSGEKSVTELETLLSARQASVSQQLARLRLEGVVRYRRDGKTIYYRLADDNVRQAIDLLYKIFCTSAQD